MIKNKTYLYLFGLIISVLIMIMAIVGIYIAGQFADFTPAKPLTKLPPMIKPTWIIVDWTFPFYFTIQSNIFVIIYLFLMTIGIIKPNKNKHAYMFELITLLNIVLTCLIYWSILSWNTNLVSNWYFLIENIGLHLIVPVIMVAVWAVRVFEVKNQEVFIKYKECWKFFIYPILWLISAIIIYYATRENVYYVFKHNFATTRLASAWIAKLSKNINIHINVIGTLVISSFAGVWGNSIYFFLNFDYIITWIPIVCILGIAFIIFILGTTFISFSNSQYFLYKKCIKNNIV